MRSLVHGLGIAGAATVRALQRLGHEVISSDDAIDPTRRSLADGLGVELRPLPADDLDRFVGGFDLVAPAPGVPEHHRLIETAERLGTRVASEIELAYEWEQERPGGARPMLAITGTDGKTTTTEMAAAILRAAGLRTVAAGNTDVPLLDALTMDVDVYVVECTSFRLAWTSSFRAEGAAWINLAPDHLNWHRSMDTYAAAKARIFGAQRPSDVSIGNITDPVVMAHLGASAGRQVTFGPGGDYRVESGDLVGPDGRIVSTASLARSLPHDIQNALAASALVLETGLAPAPAIGEALSEFVTPPHRMAFVAEIGGIRYFDDSKATTPHASLAAIRSFPSAVLIAGGRNKGLDLSPLATAAGHLRGVVAIGEAAGTVCEVFAGLVDTVVAGSMEAAVEAATRVAQPGDSVVLSPACASFDWYPTGGYPARGEHFARTVRALGERASGGGTRQEGTR
ncbi:MAG: UDP-N-acetylmuramoyl-L-alanine--D-glutamate ligase [Ilumatobacteraceae bacterium]